MSGFHRDAAFEEWAPVLKKCGRDLTPAAWASKMGVSESTARAWLRRVRMNRDHRADQRLRRGRGTHGR